MLAFGDVASGMYLWASHVGAKACVPGDLAYGAPPPTAPLELVPPPPSLPSHPPQYIDDTTPLSVVGMPYYDAPLLSVFASTHRSNVGRLPPQPPAEILARMNTTPGYFVGVASNPRRRFRRNMLPSRHGRKDSKELEIPKSLSEQERTASRTKSALRPVRALYLPSPPLALTHPTITSRAPLVSNERKRSRRRMTRPVSLCLNIIAKLRFAIAALGLKILTLGRP